ncbi:hypothetical protein Tco_0924085 [Tanacetum coccineum]|uniref:Uncharacterized protein n=1 Tax=Tanacetum coccineum TaxID=301880 RepID=A0ABQ5D2U8_9ASTR
MISYSSCTNQPTSPQLENEDFQQMDGDDLEELDLRWQVAMLTVREKSYTQMNLSSKELVVKDGLGGLRWSLGLLKLDPVNLCLMAISSSSSSSSSDSEELDDYALDGQDRVIMWIGTQMREEEYEVQTVRPENSHSVWHRPVVSTARPVVLLEPMYKNGQWQSQSFKLLDESQVVLRAPRKDDVYSLIKEHCSPLRLFLGYLPLRTGPNWMFDLDFLTNSMNYIPVSVENQVNVDAGTQDSYVAGSSGKDKGPTQEYILLPLQPYRTRIPVEDVPPAAHEKPSKSSPKENDVQDSEDAANKESEQDLQDELEKMVTQELAAKAMDDVSRQAFEEEKRRIASQKKAAQATSTNKLSTDRPSVSTDRPSVSTDRPSVSTDRPFVSTDRSNTPYVSAASTSTGANAGESSFVYLGGKIPIDASTLPNEIYPWSKYGRTLKMF